MQKHPEINESNDELSLEQLAMIEHNLELSIDERIMQLQSAVDLIEELRRSMEEQNAHRLQNPLK